MPGVIIKAQHLQIDLRTYGFGRERLELLPTPANIRYAENLRKEILGKIERGTFALGDYFPDSPRVKQDAPSMTLGELFSEWLGVKKPELQQSTFGAYEQTINSYHFDGVRNVRIGDFGFRELKQLSATLPANAKTFNNVASVLRQALEYGYRAKIIKEPLHIEIEMRKSQKPGPDPLTMIEVELLLPAFKSPVGRDYFAFAIFSGMRPSEIIALEWSSVDLPSGTVLVNQALTRGIVKGTKTSVVRTVELTQRALQVIENQRARTQLAGGRVFCDDDGLPFTTTDTPLNRWWRPAMKLVGLRHRDARQARHTFATLCLTASITPAWVARQMGHSVEMFYRVYSRWIDGADKGAERRKLDAFIDGDESKNGTKNGTRHQK